MEHHGGMLGTVLPFLGACLLIAASPGPSTMLIVRRSLQSRRSGFLTVLGNETGVFIWGVAAAFGLTVLLAASKIAYDVVRFVGAGVLIWFGAQALWSARRKTANAMGEQAEETPSGWRSYRGGLGLNLANPKAAVFAMSFLPQFVSHNAPKLPTMIALAALWAIFEIGYYGLYVWFVGRMKAVFDRGSVRRRLEQVSGGVLVALGVRMALES
jgi:threonine/homoserine/homoserine lactone efflux protein